MQFYSIHFILITYISCAWYSHTIQDEIQRHSDVFYIISGQFPHHGDAYWKKLAEKSKAKLNLAANDIQARNDLAVSHMKLRNYTASLRELKKIEQLSPGRYETYSNLGVLYKKMRKFSKAVHYTKKALAIKPEGHLGLGDWYLKMLEYKAKIEKTDSEIQKNFLGMEYLEDPIPYSLSHDQDHREVQQKLRLLLEADNSFSDAYIALGDEFFISRRQYLVSLWCYLRAQKLGHPRPDIVKQRIDRTYEIMKYGANAMFWSYYINDKEVVLNAVSKELKECEKWLEEFYKVEADLLKKHENVDFNMTYREMKKRGIARKKPQNHAIQERLMPYHYILFALIAILLGTKIYKDLQKEDEFDENGDKIYRPFRFYLK
ncbi:tetratricopeptide repeat protein [Candidatus Uabimicrobium amorphum]|uniref:Tetratricopeptide repeat protein n=1 Tax=Uabimicrobium amorphum TaxID=2596890 RepID=A0A5S9F6M0_UABAM|nr:tetratricopeptide repeat protein [Candidatus Uabimicrobium amorphum]BBM86829.1 hypothetical protein UABAM_05217 [Candidatus Uabimicrobium amorphum]